MLTLGRKSCPQSSHGRRGRCHDTWEHGREQNLVAWPRGLKFVPHVSHGFSASFLASPAQRVEQYFRFGVEGRNSAPHDSHIFARATAHDSTEVARDMSDQIMTPQLAKWRAYCDGSIVAGAIAVYILKAAEADSTLRTRTTWAAVKAAAGNTEADFANYAAKTGVTPTVIPGTAQVSVDVPDQTWASAGTVGSPQNLAKLIVCWRPTLSPTDANTIPLAHLDYPEIANGASIVAEINATGILLATG